MKYDKVENHTKLDHNGNFYIIFGTYSYRTISSKSQELFIYFFEMCVPFDVFLYDFLSISKNIY